MAASIRMPASSARSCSSFSRRSRTEGGADVLGWNGRQITLDIDHAFGPALGIEVLQRLVNPVRAGGVVGAGHDDRAAMGLHSGRDLGRVGGNRHPADFGLLGALQY